MESQELEPQPRRQSVRQLVGIVLILLGLLLFGLSSLIGTGGGGGRSYETGPTALSLAKAAFQWRATHRRTGHNFGNGAIILWYADGSAQSIVTSDIFEGLDGPPDDVNAFHSERLTQERFVLPTLVSLQAHGALVKGVNRIDVVFFTQYHVCKRCFTQMRDWQDQQRAKANSVAVYMTVYQLTRVFYPLAQDPRRRAQPLVKDEGDIETVAVRFDEKFTPTTPGPGPAARPLMIARASFVGRPALTVEREFATMQVA